MRLLDFGAGNGRYLDVFSKVIPPQNLYGAEVDPVMIHSIIQKGYTALDLSGSDTIPFETGYFDVVFSSNVLEHLEKDSYHRYLFEIHRVLSDDGFFLVGMPNYPTKRFYDIYKAFSNTAYFKYYLFDDPTHINKLSIASFSKDLEIYFSDIKLIPSFSILQRVINYFNLNLDQTSLFSLFCDKYFGYAKEKKPSKTPIEALKQLSR